MSAALNRKALTPEETQRLLDSQDLAAASATTLAQRQKDTIDAVNGARDDMQQLVAVLNGSKTVSEKMRRYEVFNFSAIQKTLLNMDKRLNYLAAVAKHQQTIKLTPEAAQFIADDLGNYLGAGAAQYLADASKTAVSEQLASLTHNVNALNDSVALLTAATRAEQRRARRTESVYAVIGAVLIALIIIIGAVGGAGLVRAAFGVNIIAGIGSLIGTVLAVTFGFWASKRLGGNKDE